MKRILFVDDEPRILSGLKRMLHSRSKEWALEFAEGPERALELIATHSFDVVVSDMRMPGMNGAQLLERVKAQVPGAIRIILSGESELEAAVRAVAVAHQYMTKPCDPKKLQETLARALSLQDVLVSEDLRSIVSGISTLPSPPKVFQALSAALADPDCDIDRVVEIVRHDVGLCAKTLQIVNSSFFGLARQISDIKQAVTYLGLSTLKDVVLGAEVFRQFDGAKLPPGFDMEAEQLHAIAASHLARKLIVDKQVGEFAFTAAMLHDIGLWILAIQRPEEFQRIQRIIARPADAQSEAERIQALNVHARLGGYLLGIWGLPYPVVEAVAHHHQPSVVSPGSFDALGAVHVANCLVRYAAAGDEASRSSALAGLDHVYLARLGVEGSIAAWSQLAVDELAACT